MDVSTFLPASASGVASSWETLVVQPPCQLQRSRPVFALAMLYKEESGALSFVRRATTRSLRSCGLARHAMIAVKDSYNFSAWSTVCATGHIVMLSAVAQPDSRRAMQVRTATTD